MNICYISLKNDGIKKAKYIVLNNLHKNTFNTCFFPFLAFSQLPLMDLSSNPENIKKFKTVFSRTFKRSQKIFCDLLCEYKRSQKIFCDLLSALEKTFSKFLDIFCIT